MLSKRSYIEVKRELKVANFHLTAAAGLFRTSKEKQSSWKHPNMLSAWLPKMIPNPEGECCIPYIIPIGSSIEDPHIWQTLPITRSYTQAPATAQR